MIWFSNSWSPSYVLEFMIGSKIVNNDMWMFCDLDIFCSWMKMRHHVYPFVMAMCCNPRYVEMLELCLQATIYEIKSCKFYVGVLHG
jgi:hypothetical protein